MRPTDEEPVRLTSAQNGVEAEMIEALLREHGIACLIRRSGGADNPEFFAAGARELLVLPSAYARARELVESHFGLR